MGACTDVGLLLRWGVGGIYQVDAIVFLVDAHDRERFPEAKKELDGLLSDDGLSTVPFLVLGNKIDNPASASEVQPQGRRLASHSYRARTRSHVCTHAGLRARLELADSRTPASRLHYEYI